MAQCSSCGSAAKYASVYPVRISYWQWHLWLSGITDNRTRQHFFYCDDCWVKHANDLMAQVDDGWCLVINLANANLFLGTGVRRKKRNRRIPLRDLLES